MQNDPNDKYFFYVGAQILLCITIMIALAWWGSLAGINDQQRKVMEWVESYHKDFHTMNKNQLIIMDAIKKLDARTSGYSSSSSEDSHKLQEDVSFSPRPLLSVAPGK